MKKINLVILLLFPLYVISVPAWAQKSCQVLFSANERPKRIIKVPEGFIDTFGQLSQTKEQYNQKKKYYLNSSIYRGDVAQGALNLDTVISYFTKVKAPLVGNGVANSVNTIRQSFEKYNRRVENKDIFFDYLSAHHRGDGEKYWDSLMTSWSQKEGVSNSYFDPYNFYNYNTLPALGYGLKIKALQPRTGLDAIKIEKNGQYGYNYKAEFEVSVVGATDPEFISEAIFVKYKKNIDHFEKYQDAPYFYAKRVGFDTVRIIEGKDVRKNIYFNFDQVSTFDPVAVYEVKIQADGTYKIFKIK